ncbi:uncharacterized protein CC84DRAFT_608191 [Paraphaeosphaeria sporulosa]|uniref:Uncharacterized protein n=1 Tax=Paraphaeosphaeria sporulosa TaxID=1460663 RepID=A0A177CNM1_9PLEO|nr:uncharacterized protein CC84DRAFT_608191 [Paraphaeosphaeria sporulosa]OAG09135.1 hypothetical protein CC84DRAFT_608191 [Paraphaeosphaeria sporulosa]
MPACATMLQTGGAIRIVDDHPAIRSITASACVLSRHKLGRLSGVPSVVSDVTTVMGIGASNRHRGGASAASGSIANSILPSGSEDAGCAACETRRVRWSPVKTPLFGTNRCGTPTQSTANKGIERFETACRDTPRHVGRRRLTASWYRRPKMGLAVCVRQMNDAGTTLSRLAQQARQAQQATRRTQHLGASGSETTSCRSSLPSPRVYLLFRCLTPARTGSREGNGNRRDHLIKSRHLRAQPQQSNGIRQVYQAAGRVPAGPRPLAGFSSVAELTAAHPHTGFHSTPNHIPSCLCTMLHP